MFVKKNYLGFEEPIKSFLDFWTSGTLTGRYGDYVSPCGEYLISNFNDTRKWFLIKLKKLRDCLELYGNTKDSRYNIARSSECLSDDFDFCVGYYKAITGYVEPHLTKQEIIDSNKSLDKEIESL